MANTDLDLGNDATAANNLKLRADGAGGGAICNGAGTVLQTISATDAIGTFTGTLTGVTTTVTGTFRYVKRGNVVTLTPTTAAFTGTSNTNAKTITGMPAALFPSASVLISALVLDNGGTQVVGMARIETSGVMTFWKDANAGAWTTSGTTTISPLAVSYSI